MLQLRGFKSFVDGLHDDNAFFESAHRLLADISALKKERTNKENESTFSEKEETALNEVMQTTQDIAEFDYSALQNEEAGSEEQRKTSLKTLNDKLHAYNKSANQLRSFPWGKVIAASMLTLLSVAVIAASAALIAVSLGAATPAVFPAISAYFAAMPAMWAAIGGVGAFIGATLGAVAGTLFHKSVQPNAVRSSVHDVEAAARQSARPRAAN